METSSHTLTNSTNNFIYFLPYYQRTSECVSFTDSQFLNWKEKIDKYVYDTIEFHLEDLPDLQYRKWFDEGYLKPEQVSHIVLAEYYQNYYQNQLYI